MRIPIYNKMSNQYSYDEESYNNAMKTFIENGGVVSLYRSLNENDPHDVFITKPSEIVGRITSYDNEYIEFEVRHHKEVIDAHKNPVALLLTLSTPNETNDIIYVSRILKVLIKETEVM